MSEWESREVSPTPVNNTAQGWGVIGFVTALAIIFGIAMYIIHKRTFHDPMDPRFGVVASQTITTA